MNAALIITIGIILVPITALILIGLGKIFLMQKEEFWKSPFRFFILTVMPICFLNRNNWWGSGNITTRLL